MKNLAREARRLLSVESIHAPIPHQSALQARVDAWILRSAVGGVALAVIVPTTVFAHRLSEYYQLTH